MATLGERLVTPDVVIKGRSKAADVHPELAASWPVGASWPPAPEVAADRIRVRRIRRIAAVVPVRGRTIDLLSAVTAPLRDHLHLIAQYLPIAVVQAAGALTAIAGIGMIMLSRGILKGQRRSWLVAVALLVASLALHLVHSADVITLLVCAGVLTLLIVQRELFRAQTEQATPRHRVRHPRRGRDARHPRRFHRGGGRRPRAPPPAPGLARGAGSGRPSGSSGSTGSRFPPTIDRYVSVSLLAVGISLIVVALYLLTRPVVDRRLSSGRASVGRRAAELRARDIVRRHGTGTLDYFALRDDKQWFFHRDSLVAYAVFGGVCLVSPDPIGPSPSGPRMGLVPPLRGPQRVGPRRHGCGRGVAPDVPGLGHALPLHRRRGRRRPARVLARGREDEGPAPGGQPRGALRLHRALPRPGTPEPGRRGLHGRADGQEPPRGAGARLLHDAGPPVRPPGHRAAADAGRGTRRGPGGHVPVRPLTGHRRLLARPHAPGPG